MNSHLQQTHNILCSIETALKQTIIGQDDLITKLIVTIFAGGHALLEGVPGLGKTKTIRTLARILELPHQRISFTPDLLPSDLIGTEIYQPGKGIFTIRKGPIFTNILLADEINRTPPKVQSALLEAMEEKQITIAEKTFQLDTPFIVFATQNPLEHEGTYPLPEAQLDRFLMKIILTYPDAHDEKRIFKQETSSIPPAPPEKTLLDATDIPEIIDFIAKSVRVDTHIYDYISSILSATRELATQENPVLIYGASSRAGLALIRASRVYALLQKRDFVLPADIKFLAHDILDHRIGISYQSLTQGVTAYKIIDTILDTVALIELPNIS